MKKSGVLWVVLLGLVFGACSEDKKACDKSGNDRPFATCCTANSECASGVCYKFGDGTQACSQTCNTAADCPEGSQGKKCNGQGYCRT